MPTQPAHLVTSVLADLHSTRQALLSRSTTLEAVWASCRAVAHSPACRHVAMPGGLFAANTVPETPPESAQTITQASTQTSGPAPPPNAGIPLAGLPISVKDLFDVAGQITAAGSTVLANAAPAPFDCPAVARLKAAGGVLAMRTNMVEFAFSGVGINPHYGTPVNPADLRVERIPGGSSSGAAVSVTTGAVFVGLGSDTGGSIRIPAALCGIVGFKSTARWVPTAGALPLSTSLDTVCALTRSVRDAITVHEVLAARSVRLSTKPMADYRFAVAHTLMQDGLQDPVASAFEHSLRALRQAGAQIVEIGLSEIAELKAINATGGLPAPESYAWHRHLLATHQAAYDPRVASRILRGAVMHAFEYIDLLAARADWIARMETRLQGFDAVLSPTVPIVAPPIASVVHDDAAFFSVNAQLLRNTSVVNMLDGCALSLPCHAPGALPVGLMVWHAALHDDAILGAAWLIEAALR